MLVGGFVAALMFGVKRETIEQQTAYFDFEKLQNARLGQSNQGKSSFGAEINVSTREGAISAIPVGLVYLLFAPFPWSISGLRQLLTLPETLVWYGLMPALVRGLLLTLRTRLRPALPILVFATTLTLAYAMFQSNVGTAYRQRTQISMFFFIFMGVGIEHKREQRERRAQRTQATRYGTTPSTGLAAVSGWRRRLRLVALVLVGLLPNLVKRPLYRLFFGYRIGRGVRIGWALLDAQKLQLGEGTIIGHFNLVLRVAELRTGRQCRVGMLNIVRGGARVILGDYVSVMRLNVLNSIPDHDCTTTPTSELELGDGTIVVSGHRIDFTDAVTIGKNVIIGGRNSSLWTHNRQQTAPIKIGDFCYLGSEIRAAPGARLASECILALGSVLASDIDTPRSLVGGVPAKVVRPLNDDDLVLVHRKTRDDIPDDLYAS